MFCLFLRYASFVHRWEGAPVERSKMEERMKVESADGASPREAGAA